MENVCLDFIFVVEGKIDFVGGWDGGSGFCKVMSVLFYVNE